MYGLLTATALLALGSFTQAQRPSNVSICDYYTTALLKENNATNQYTVLTLVVNTALIGNYTQPNVGVTVNGILNPGMYNNTDVNLLPYFSGALLSTNDGGSSGVSVNFLDDGGAAPLKMNKPSNGNTSSNQYMLVTHLYEFFGILLGCSEVGQNGFPPYGGDTSMYDVHKFMDIDAIQMGYFITQVGLAAASFGVATEDVTAVGMALTKLFDYRCSPPTAIVPGSQPELQSICINPQCPLDANATCSAYGTPTMPMAASNSSSSSGSSSSGSSSSTGTSTGSSPAMQTTNAAVKNAAGLVTGLAAALAACLML